MRQLWTKAGRLLAIVVLSMAIINTGGCGNGRSDPPPERAIESDYHLPVDHSGHCAAAAETDNSEVEEFMRPELSSLPPVLQKWVEYSRRIFLGQSLAYNGRVYLLATYGEQPTGGYSVRITDVERDDQAINAHVLFKEPAPGEIVTEAVTYPFDLVSIDDTDRPVFFHASGAETYLMTLLGIDYLRPIVAESRWIKVFTPAPNEEFYNTIYIDGVASVFEGTVNYRLLDEQGEVIVESHTLAAMGDWGYFKVEIPLGAGPEPPPAGPLQLELFTYSPRDGAKENELTIPVLYSP